MQFASRKFGRCHWVFMQILAHRPNYIICWAEGPLLYVVAASIPTSQFKWTKWENNALQCSIHTVAAHIPYRRCFVGLLLLLGGVESKEFILKYSIYAKSLGQVFNELKGLTPHGVCFPICLLLLDENFQGNSWINKCQIVEFQIQNNNELFKLTTPNQHNYPAIILRICPYNVLYLITSLSRQSR